jgi:hypothetical protein
MQPNTQPNNVSNISDKQPAPATAKFTITAQVEGFPISIEIIDANADKLLAMINRLKAIGAEPPTAAKPEPTKAASAPLCPTHNTPMAPSTKRIGTYYCKSSVGQAEDGRTLYCTKKA